MFAVVVAAGIAWLFASAWPTTGARKIAGLTAPVEILRDAWGVPHIFAGSGEDAATALGWAHAEDRLWQMEMTRRLGAGRLAEVFGASALPSDRFMRTLGLYRLAKQQFPLLSTGTQHQLTAYAVGVNAAITARRWRLPPEFLLSGVEPEAWTPADSLVWLKLMAMRLSANYRDELLRARLAQRLSATQLRALWPDDPPLDPRAPLGAASPLDPNVLGRLALLTAGPPGQPQGASNAWVIAGARTTSGLPILANDPHLAFQLPLPWTLARITTPDGTHTGATAPGFPAIILGHNDRIAWGITSSDIDVEDVFVERTRPGDPGHYDAPQGPLAFQVSEEVIKVAGGEPERLIVRRSRHGPVLSDLGVSVPEPAETPASDGGSSGAPLAVALAATWLAEDDRTPDALLAVGNARNWDEFRAAAGLATAPQQNVFYADVDGHIGFIAAGRIPLRRNGDGRMPVPGWTGDYDWDGFLPFEAQPQAVDPTAGVLFNANNRPMIEVSPRSAGYWLIHGSWDDGFRARRIQDLLAEAPPQSLDAVAAMQIDAVSLSARALLPRMLSALPHPERHAVMLDLLRRWSGAMDRSRPEPLIFTAWLRELVQELTADALGPEFERYWADRPRFVEASLTGENGWCAALAASGGFDCRARVQAALDRAIDGLRATLGDDVRAWQWGELHRARFDHPFWQHVPLIGGFASRSIADDGGNDTINRAAMRFSDRQDPYAAVHGAGFRGVYDLGDLSRSRFVLAAGQSGNPLSAHYRDQMPMWRDGDGVCLDQSLDSLRSRASSRLVLHPE